MTLVLLFWWAGSISARPQQELVFFTWEDYIAPDVVAAFEQENDCRVRFVYFATDEERNQQLAETRVSGYDLAIVNGAMLAAYRDFGWIQPIVTGAVPNLRYLDPRWVDAFPAAREYGVPYFWGTLGLVYRADLIDKPPTSWAEFFHPPAEWGGKLMAISDSRDLLTAGFKALGFSLNSSDEGELQQVEQLLLAQRPMLKAYGYPSIRKNSLLLSGDLIVAMAYNGDAVALQGFNDQISFVVPREGTNLWVDYLVILAGSSEQELAHRFINHLQTPENAARQAEYLYFATPNQAAEKRLPEAFLNNPIIYPLPEVLARSEFHQELPPDAVRRRNSVFARLQR